MLIGRVDDVVGQFALVSGEAGGASCLCVGRARGRDVYEQGS